MEKLKIIFEDNHIIVVEKPVNIPSQGDKTGDIDMLSIIKEYLKEKYNKPGNVYLGLVHRLDRPVGGVMVFAKTSKAASRLSNEIRLGKIEKRYIALVHNKTKDKDILKDKLIKNKKTHMSYVNDLGKESILEYNLLNYKNNMSLLEINLITGRHHQIRVQLSHHGYPIYGDQKYGIDKEGIQIHLWAYKLKFNHPVKDEIMNFTYYPDWYKEC